MSSINNTSTANYSKVSIKAYSAATLSKEEEKERLARAEASLREWIAFRETWLRKASKGKLRLEKKEAIV